MQSRQVYILSTGTELSCGHSIDTNAPYLARFLSQEGFFIRGSSILPDDPKILRESIRLLLNSKQGLELLIMTGGLGPTDDDHSVDILAQIYETEVIEDPKALKRLKEICRRNPESIDLEEARAQVRIPKGAKVLDNPVGLAPGFIMEAKASEHKHGEKAGCLLAALPGVPQEMEAIFHKQLWPFLKQRFQRSLKERRIFYIYNIGESSFQSRFLKAEKTKTECKAPLFLSSELPKDFLWGLSADLGKLKVVLESGNADFLDKMLKKTKLVFGEHFMHEEASLALHHICTRSGVKIGTAESCTGGLIATSITDHPGSSVYFQGSIVSYANAVKESHLKVPSAVLREKGAVSEECALAMARGLLEKLGLDFALAISGIAGPQGGENKPVGLVYIACAAKQGRSQSFSLNRRLDRAGVRNYSTQMALFYFYKFIKEEGNYISKSTKNVTLS